MKSIQHVFWRGVLALGLMAIGVGSGIGMPPATVAASADRADCARQTRILVVHGSLGEMPGSGEATAFVVRGGNAPTRPKS